MYCNTIYFNKLLHTVVHYSLCKIISTYYFIYYIMPASETIVVSKETKERLKSLKIIDQDTFDNVIKRLLDKQDKEFENK